HTARQSTEERQNLRTPKLLAQNRRSLCINPVHLKNMLRQVQSDRRNLAHGWLPFAAVSIRQQFGTQMPQRGHPPHHSITSSASASSFSGTFKPRGCAVLRLITNSNFVGCSRGRVAGLTQLRILPASMPIWVKASARCEISPPATTNSSAIIDSGNFQVCREHHDLMKSADEERIRAKECHGSPSVRWSAST